ncbi:MAG: ZIP family metal transporter [Solirubrobacterales bacterium]
MSFAETALLGGLAGFTIFLGLPFGRIRVLSLRARVALAMFSVGVLAFLFAEVLSHGIHIMEGQFERLGEGEQDGSWGTGIFYAAILAAGFTAGVAGIAALEARMRPPKAPPMAGGSPDAATVQDVQALSSAGAAADRGVLRMGMTIASAIGLHNFAEGLAIGVAASTGDASLATVLIVGFGVHNTTEGFGIIGPLGTTRPSWNWLLVAGLIAGTPTLIGTMVGYQLDSETLSLLFYSLSAGAILYVIGEIWGAMRKLGHRELGLVMIAAGVFLGAATEMIIAYGGLG